MTTIMPCRTRLRGRDRPCPPQVSAADDRRHHHLRGLVLDAESHRSIRGARFDPELTMQTTGSDVDAADVPNGMGELDRCWR